MQHQALVTNESTEKASLTKMSMLLKEAKQIGSPFQIFVKGHDFRASPDIVTKENSIEVDGPRDASPDTGSDGFISHRQKGWKSKRTNS